MVLLPAYFFNQKMGNEYFVIENTILMSDFAYLVVLCNKFHEKKFAV
jgi:uncharacterized protein YdaL